MNFITSTIYQRYMAKCLFPPLFLNKWLKFLAAWKTPNFTSQNINIFPKNCIQHILDIKTGSVFIPLLLRISVNLTETWITKIRKWKPANNYHRDPFFSQSSRPYVERLITADQLVYTLKKKQHCKSLPETLSKHVWHV